MAAPGSQSYADRLMAIFERAPIGVSLTDLNGCLLRQNAALCRLLGYSDEELRGKCFSELTHPEDVESDWALFEELIHGERQDYQTEKRYVRQDGQIVWARLAVSLVRDGQGRPAMEFAIVEDISERKRAEGELTRSHEQLQIILQNIDDGITVQDQSGRLVYANAAAARLSGYTSADELLAAPPGEAVDRFEVVDAEGDPVAIQDLPGRRALEGEEPEAQVLGFRVPATGAERWSILKATPIRDERGQVVLAVNVFVDITAQRQADAERGQRLAEEQAARRQAEESRQRMAFLAEAGAVLSSSLDYQKTLDAVAHLAVTLIADWCVVETVTSGGVIERVAAAHREPAKEQWAREIERRYPTDSQGATAQVMRTGKSMLVPDVADEMLVGAARDEEHLAILRQLGMRSVMTVPLSARGQVLGSMTFIAAESGRRYSDDDLSLAEGLAYRAALAVDNARLYRETVKVGAEREAILQQMADGVIIADAGGNFIFSNNAARQITGDVGPSSVAHSEPNQLLTLEGAPYPRDELPLVRALRGETVTDAGWRLQRTGGREIVLEGSATPVRDEQGNLLGAVTTFRDVTAHRELDRQKDEFLSLVSHELRTPLTVLRGYMQLIERRDANDALKHPFAVMGRQVTQLTNLIGELLDVSRIQTGRLECHTIPLDYRALVLSIVDDLSILHAGHTIDVQVPPAVRVTGDELRLRQVLVNLIDNGLKYGPDDGAVTVRVERDGEAVTTYVSDTGSPLPMEERERIFDRFYRIASRHPDTDGLGIGLAISRAIVESHGGRIRVEDRDHTCFAFSLPAADNPV